MRLVHRLSTSEERVINMSEEANEISDSYYDETTLYRKNNPYKGNHISVISKSRGLLLRIAGVMSLLRTALGLKNSCRNESMDDDEVFLSSQLDIATNPEQNINETEVMVSKDDIEKALHITRYVVQTMFIICDTGCERSTNRDILVDNRNKRLNLKQPVPQPENMSIEFLAKYRSKVLRILRDDEIEMSTVTKNGIYPEINGEKGKDVADRFVKGLVSLNLGKIYFNSNGKKIFKRFHPDSEDCPDSERVAKKWADLQLR